MGTSEHDSRQAPPAQEQADSPQDAAQAPVQALPLAGAEPAWGTTLDLFSDLPPAPAAPPAGSKGKGKATRQRAAAERRAAPDAASTARVPLAVGGHAPSGPGPTEAALRHGVEQALLTLPADQLQGVVGQLATTIVRSGEFQVALRAQLYTLVAPAISDALRGALSAQEIRQSLREAWVPGAAPLPPGAVTREAAAPAYATVVGGAAQPAWSTSPPGVAQLAPSSSPGPMLQPGGDAVLLAGYEPAVARSHKAALAEAGYEVLIVEIGPNDQALPPEAFLCGIACLPDDVAEHVESLVSRHPLHKVLRVSASSRRLVEAVELEKPLQREDAP
jgi:hypothetical protein